MMCITYLYGRERECADGEVVHVNAFHSQIPLPVFSEEIGADVRHLGREDQLSSGQGHGLELWGRMRRATHMLIHTRTHNIFIVATHTYIL